jgi:predicted dehydrogenase
VEAKTVEMMEVKVMMDINVAIVGCGYVDNSHLAAWHRIPYAKVLAVCDNNEQAAERTAKKWKIPQKFTSVSEMSDSKLISLWDICTPINSHKDLAIQAMKDGFDALIEKPLTITLKEAKEIVDCQKATGRKVGVIHNWLFEPPVLKARDIIKRGDIGEIVSAHIDVLQTKGDQMSSNQHHWSHKLPGGRITEMLIHPIYLLQHFLGKISLQDLNVSKLGAYPWMKHDELVASFRAAQKFASIYVSFSAPRNSIYISLFGRLGIVKLDIIAATLNVLHSSQMGRFEKVADSIRQAYQLSSSTFGGALKVLSGRWFDGHEMCIRLFAQSAVREKDPPVTVEEGYAAVRVLEDVYHRIESI